jgi:hypothetical protein
MQAIHIPLPSIAGGTKEPLFILQHLTKARAIAITTAANEQQLSKIGFSNVHDYLAALDQ